MKQTLNLSSWNKGLSRGLKLSTLGIAVLMGTSTLAQAAEQLISNNYQRNLKGDQEISLSQELRLDQRSGMVNSVIVVASTALGKGQLQVVLNGQVFSSQQVGQSLQAIQIPVHRELRRDIQDLRIHTMGNFTIAMTGVTLDDLSPFNPGPGPVPPFPPPTPIPSVSHLFLGDIEKVPFNFQARDLQEVFNQCMTFSKANHIVVPNELNVSIDSSPLQYLNTTSYWTK